MENDDSNISVYTCQHAIHFDRCLINDENTSNNSVKVTRHCSYFSTNPAICIKQLNHQTTLYLFYHSIICCTVSLEIGRGDAARRYNNAIT